MVMFLVSVCWCRINIYKPSKWTFFRILHQNRVQNIIQCHDNNIWKQIYIKDLCYSTETYLQYKVQRGKTGWKIHVRSTSRTVPIPTKWELFLLCTREWDQRDHLGLDHVNADICHGAKFQRYRRAKLPPDLHHR